MTLVEQLMATFPELTKDLKSGITDPLLPITFPYLTTLKIVPLLKE